MHNITFNGLLESSLNYDSGYQSIVLQAVVHHCIAGATPLVKYAPIPYSLPCFIYLWGLVHSWWPLCQGFETVYRTVIIKKWVHMKNGLNEYSNISLVSWYLPDSWRALEYAVVYAAPFVVDTRCAQYECVGAAAIFYVSSDSTAPALLWMSAQTLPHACHRGWQTPRP